MARIEDYALIGDLQTAALVGRDGSIDWCCFPRFDSAACFAALLGDAENGRWLLAPASAVRHAERRYRHDTLILETVHETVGRRGPRHRLHATAGPGARPRPDRRGRPRARADALGAPDPVRLRPDRPLGATRRRRARCGRRAGCALLSHRRRRPRRGRRPLRVRRRGRSASPVRPDLAPVAPDHARAGRRRGGARRHRGFWLEWAQRLHAPGRVPRGIRRR